MAGKERSIVAIIFRNFIRSFIPRQMKVKQVGQDYLGNKYFERPAEPGNRNKKPTRWFEPVTEKDTLDQEVPVEWDAWLRGRRTQPPEEREILMNRAIMKLKQLRANELSNRDPPLQLPHICDPGSKKSFPKYEEYEVSPGTKTGVR